MFPIGVMTSSTIRMGIEMNIYKISFASKCPVNDDQINYHLEIRSTSVIKAEEIEWNVPGWPQLHEEMADSLFHRFGGYQILRATHRRVLIETHRGQP
jgi:hypothetical protein